ncbi:DoxX family protein [Microvirgula curvata]|uniref:DoxX family protein n=1 Tax=Microvirgula aerodenitrificans TaxID=57480 RepID=A0A2U3THM5_9NEIS|nr:MULTISPECIES: DoxX family protein [Microvirgula]AVY92923.1 DoxX family protein [Microvirgula aerodenitrificans]RAS17698.1 putative oxidoreductase [Microvirgula sp. AG722]
MTRNAPLFAIARILMAVIFIISGFGKITGFAGTTAWMASMGLPFPAVLLVLATVVELGGGIALALGFQVRYSAALLALFTLAITPVFHAFWAAAPEAAEIQQLMFLKNLAMAGGLIHMANWDFNRRQAA